jgi:hypothetical protein
MTQLNNIINMKKETKEEVKKRQIIIETDGNVIQIIKAEVAGFIELSAIFDNVKQYFIEQHKK